MQKSRSINKPLKIEQLKAEIQAASKSFLLTKNLSFAKGMVKLWLASFFPEEEEGDPSRTAPPVPSSNRVPVVKGGPHPLSLSTHQPGGGQTSGHSMD